MGWVVTKTGPPLIKLGELAEIESSLSLLAQEGRPFGPILEETGWRGTHVGENSSSLEGRW